MRKTGVNRLSGGKMLGLAGVVALIGLSNPAAASPRFDVPPGLEHQVHFWQDVFTVYSRHQVAIHDTARLDRVYSVVDFSDLADSGLTPTQIEVKRKRALEAERKRIRAILLRLHRGASPRTEEEARIRALFRGDRSPKRFQHAARADRLRSQTGLRERFAEGISIGHHYFPVMEAIFAEEGVPIEITRLPLVESTFNLRAYSRVGAAGLWQFMPATARMFSLSMNEAVDERLDPIAATRAAARFLRQSYRSLGSWPLAIMAYNHGPAGIARAVRTIGTTDEVEIIRRYKGKSFRFASRNFYPEFLAALEVERNFVDYYGPIPRRLPRRTEVVELPHYVSIGAVSRCSGATPEEIADFNPALLPAVYQGKQRIPRGYRLHLPDGDGRRFIDCYRSLPSAEKHDRQRRQYVVHRVRRGQTLGQIARRYGSSVEKIRRRNGLRNKNFIREGQILRIPTG